MRNLTSASADGKLAVNATLGRKTGAIDAKVDGKMKLSALNPAYKGSADAHVAVQRAGGRFSGDVDANIHGFALDPTGKNTIDGTAKITAKDGNLVAAIEAKSPKAGTAKIDVDVNGPRDMGDVAAWKTLTRTAVKDLHIQLTKLDVDQLGKVMGKPAASLGQINGDIRITPDNATGDIQVRGVRASMRDVGVIDADVKLKQTGADELSTSAQARLGSYGTLDATAKLGMPATPVRSRGVEAPRARRDPRRDREELGDLVRAGHAGAVRHRVAVPRRRVGPGRVSSPRSPARSSRSTCTDFRGGAIVSPIAVHLDGALDSKGVTAIGTVRNGSITLLSISSKIPVTVAELRADPKALKSAPLMATVAIPAVPAKNVMAVLGNTQLTGGTFDGKIDVAGTVGKPTAKALFTARDITVPSESAKPVQAVKELTIQATWDGEAGNVAINGEETGGGKLQINAEARKDDFAHAKASLVASHLDLAPLRPADARPGRRHGRPPRRELRAFPAPTRGPRSSAATLALTDGRIPIAPVIGTLFHGDLKVEVKDKKLNVRLAGKLGQRRCPADRGRAARRILAVRRHGEADDPQGPADRHDRADHRRHRRRQRRARRQQVDREHQRRRRARQDPRYQGREARAGRRAAGSGLQGRRAARPAAVAGRR